MHIGEPRIGTRLGRLLIWSDGYHFQIEPALLERRFQVTETCGMIVTDHQQTSARFHDYRPYGNSAVRTVDTMTTFRDFCTTGLDDPDPRRAKFARVNASPAGLVVATGGVTAVGVAAMLGISYAVFRRGESGK